MTSTAALTAKSLIFLVFFSNHSSRSAEHVVDLFAYLGVSQTQRPGLRDDYHSYAFGKSRMSAYGLAYPPLESVPFYGAAEPPADYYPQTRRLTPAFQYINFKFRRLPAPPIVKYFPKNGLAGEPVRFP
jgi:hypothetical protein